MTLKRRLKSITLVLEKFVILGKNIVKISLFKIFLFMLKNEFLDVPGITRKQEYFASLDYSL